MCEVMPSLSAVAIRALLKQELITAATVKMLVERKHKLSKIELCWTVQKEMEYIEKRLTTELARLNKINGIFVKYGCRLED